MLAGTVEQIAMLSESTAIVVHVGGRPEHALSLTVPEQYARRSGLAVGSAVTVVLHPDGIHLMAAAPTVQ